MQLGQVGKAEWEGETGKCCQRNPHNYEATSKPWQVLFIILSKGNWSIKQKTWSHKQFQTSFWLLSERLDLRAQEWMQSDQTMGTTQSRQSSKVRSWDGEKWIPLRLPSKLIPIVFDSWGSPLFHLFLSNISSSNSRPSPWNFIYMTCL